MTSTVDREPLQLAAAPDVPPEQHMNAPDRHVAIGSAAAAAFPDRVLPASRTPPRINRKKLPAPKVRQGGFM
jgi:hypothetical protein